MSALARAAASTLAVVAFAAPATARAEEIPFDVRAPVRLGFAYTALTRAPSLSFSWGIELDALRITKRLAVTGVFDLDATIRPDLPDKDPRSSFTSIGIGGGLFYVTDGQVAFGVVSTVGLAFDAQDFAGVAFSTRLTFIPFYVPIAEGLQKNGDHFGAWVRSSLSLWAMARIDFTSDASGSTLAFGAAIDIMRIAFLPYVDALTKKIR